MSMDRYTQKVQIKAAEHRQLLAELRKLALSIQRCQETISALMAELNAANAKFEGQRSTRQEVEYLTILLECAKRKLAWEKQIASLQKRAPALLKALTGTLNDKEFPPTEEMKVEMLQLLQVVQATLEGLQALSADPT